MRTTPRALWALFLASGCSAAAPDESYQQGQATATGGDTVALHTLVNPGSCMDARGAGAANGTQIEEWTCNGGAAQTFQIVSGASGTVTLVNPHAGKCVDIRGAGTANGTKVELWACNGTGAQAFQARDAGGGNVTFFNPHSGKCLDVSASNPADGTVVQLWDCNGTDAQVWTRAAIGGPGSSSGSGSGSTSSSGASSGSSSSGSSSSGSGSGSLDAGDSGAGTAPPGVSAWLDPMNQARADVGEAPFQWDPIAAAVAQSWASQCSFGHNPMASSEYASMGGTGGLGEDVAAGAPTQSVSDAVASWIDERQFYGHATNTCAAGQVCGHYTQIVWKNSTAVGCAQVHCTQNSPFGSGFPEWDNSVCDFNPPGNFVGESPY